MGYLNILPFNSSFLCSVHKHDKTNIYNTKSFANIGVTGHTATAIETANSEDAKNEHIRHKGLPVMLTICACNVWYVHVLTINHYSF